MSFDEMKKAATEQLMRRIGILKFKRAHQIDQDIKTMTASSINLNVSGLSEHNSETISEGIFKMLFHTK